MTGTKYGKYIITDMKDDLKLPPYRASDKMDPKRAARGLWLDDTVIKDGFYVECVWIWKREDKGPPQSPAVAHRHNHDEVLAFFGTNPNDVNDLGGELVIWLDDEKHVITKSCLIFIPKGMKHAPLYLTKVDRPIFHFATSSAKIYEGEMA